MKNNDSFTRRQGWERDARTGELVFPDVVAAVERALEDYHFLPRLAQNPLARYLDLRKFRRLRDFGSASNGWALRRALDVAIYIIVGDDDDRAADARIRVERYLRWRYQEEVQVREIAARLNYSERHLQCLRDELIEQLAQTLLEIAPPNKFAR